jgi:hypothetical protein
MANQSSGLVLSRSRAPKAVHFAQWTAQLVIGVRALRRMVSDRSDADAASAGDPSLRPPRLPPGENGGHALGS